MSNRTDVQAAINALIAKQGVANSVTPVNLAGDQLQEMLDKSLMIDEVPSDSFAGGLFDYNDLGTTGAPISVSGGGGSVVLTNDEGGAFTNKLFPPTGVTDVWDKDNDVFDWSDLKLGDMVDIRIDVDVITTSVNTEIKIDLHLGTGGSSYTIPWILETNFKNTGTHKLNRYNGIYMGDTNTLDNGGKFMIESDKNCTIVVNGWYCKIIKRG